MNITMQFKYIFMHNRWDFSHVWWEAGGEKRCLMPSFKRKWVFQLLCYNKQQLTMSEKAFHSLPTESAIHTVAKHQLYLVWHPCLSLVWQTASHCSFPFFLIQGKNATASFSDFLLLFPSTLLRIFLIHSSLLSSLGWTGSMPVSFFSWECYPSSSIPMYLSYPDVSTLQMLFVEQGGRNR